MDNTFMSEEKRIEWYAKELEAVRARIVACEHALANGSFTSGVKYRADQAKGFIEDSLKTWKEAEQKIVDGVLQRETIEAVERVSEGAPEHPLRQGRALHPEVEELMATLGELNRLLQEHGWKSQMDMDDIETGRVLILDWSHPAWPDDDEKISTWKKNGTAWWGFPAKHVTSESIQELADFLEDDV